jgi:hypothetical protein
MKNLVAILFILIATFVPAHAEKIYHIVNDRGGKISGYDFYWRDINQKYDRVEIDGNCASACTMIFGRVPLSKICITSNGALAFHAAHGKGHIQNDRLTQEMSSDYPAPIKAWIKRHHALDTMTLTWWRAKDIHFIRHCEATPIKHLRTRKPDFLKAGKD